jgi:cytochrome bd-type quinol oxidase subunit 2
VYFNVVGVWLVLWPGASFAAVPKAHLVVLALMAEAYLTMTLNVVPFIASSHHKFHEPVHLDMFVENM